VIELPAPATPEGEPRPPPVAAGYQVLGVRVLATSDDPEAITLLDRTYGTFGRDLPGAGATRIRLALDQQGWRVHGLQPRLERLT
jgi:hypothetical protein